MSRISVWEKGLLFECRDVILYAEPYGENCVRVRETRNTTLSKKRWTLLAPEADDAKIVAESEGKTAMIKNGKLTVTMEKLWQGSRLCFYNGEKLVLASHEETEPASRYIHTEGDHYRSRVYFDAADEHIYGIGQEQQDFFDKKGCTYEIMHWNTKSTVPVIYSSRGYGFLWNNPSPGRVEFGNNHTAWSADSCYQTDYLVFVGDTPAEIVNRYCRLTGFAPKLPDWAAGFWQSKCRYESQEELLEVAREYRKRGIPVDAIVIDFFHWTEQGNCDFDPKYWPDPAKMVEELKEMGMRPVVSYWPTINPGSRNWNEMDERKLLIRTESGQYGMFDFWGQQAFVDMSNPEARKFVWEQIQKTYIQYGIRTFWLDEAEPEVHPQHFANLKTCEGNMAQNALLYPYYYAQCFYDGLKSEGEDEIVLLTRAAYPGSQKFGALVWNGDIPSNFRALRQSVVSGLSMAMCGIPWWNSDIGGFHSGNTESEEFRELILRWFEFGLFCPVMRLHGTRIKQSDYEDRYPGIICDGGGYNEIWRFGEKNYDVLKELILLRQRMKPYILECAKRTSETGEPIMRPMFFDFPEDEICYGLSDQYLFGPDILFAPIVNKGETMRKVYLPKGDWVRVALHGKGEETSVGQNGVWLNEEAQPDDFIAFVRKGAKVGEIF